MLYFLRWSGGGDGGGGESFIKQRRIKQIRENQECCISDTQMSQSSKFNHSYLKRKYILMIINQSGLFVLLFKKTMPILYFCQQKILEKNKIDKKNKQIKWRKKSR